MSTATESRAAPLLARFNNLVPYQKQHEQNGIPREVLEYLAAKKVYPVVSPANLTAGRNALAPVRGWPGLCITIAEASAMQGPVAHSHTGTLETFFCLDGRFDIVWGNQLENKLTLEPGDLCSVPRGIYRSFRNLTNQDARLLVLIQGDENMSDKIEMPRGIGAEVQQKHGDKVMELLAGINMRFQGEDAEEFSPARMQARVARSAGLKPQVDAGTETVYPIMAPEAEGRTAPVQCWPGLNVDMMIADPGQSNTATILQDKRQWVINIGDSECEISWGNERLTLGRYDMVCMEPGTTRTVRALTERKGRLLLATQGRETISH